MKKHLSWEAIEAILQGAPAILVRRFDDAYKTTMITMHSEIEAELIVSSISQCKPFVPQRARIVRGERMMRLLRML